MFKPIHEIRHQCRYTLLQARFHHPFLHSISPSEKNQNQVSSFPTDNQTLQQETFEKTNVACPSHFSTSVKEIEYYTKQFTMNYTPFWIKEADLKSSRIRSFAHFDKSCSSLCFKDVQQFIPRSGLIPCRKRNTFRRSSFYRRSAF